MSNMVINTNILALNSHRALKSVGNTIAKASERLASGLRINRAADDAAGLAISEKMRSQIRGLNQASRNAQDGISLIQTAEGALQETEDMLQRMRELIVQAANDTLEDTDRDKIALELNELSDEIDATAEKTEFNKKKLIDGSWEVNPLYLQTGANALQGLSFTIDKMDSAALGVTKTDIGNVVSPRSSIGSGGTTNPPAATGTTTDVSRPNTPIVNIGGSNIFNGSNSFDASNLTDLQANMGIYNMGGGETFQIASEGGIVLNGVTGYNNGEVNKFADLANTTITFTSGATLNVGADGKTVTYTGVAPTVDGAGGAAADLGAGDVAAADASATVTFANADTLAVALDGTVGDLSNATSFTFTLAAGSKVAKTDGTLVNIVSGNAYTLAQMTTMFGGSGTTEISFLVDGAQTTLDGTTATLQSTSVPATPKIPTVKAPVAGNIVNPGTSVNPGGGINPPTIATSTDVSKPNTPVKSIGGSNIFNGSNSFDASNLLNLQANMGIYNVGGGQTFQISSEGGVVLNGVAPYRNGEVNTFKDLANKTITFANGSTLSVGLDEKTVTFTGVTPTLDGAGGATVDLDVGDVIVTDTSAAVTFANADTLTVALDGANGNLNTATGFTFTLAPSSKVAKTDGTTVNVVSGTSYTLTEMITMFGGSGTTEISFLVDDAQTTLNGASATLQSTSAPATLKTTTVKASAVPGPSRGQAISQLTDTLDSAIEAVSSQRAKLGAYQNRLEHTIKNLDTASENLSASESRIRDADMAKEMMNLTKANVLSQAATSVLAQANMAPQNILQLLR